MIDYFAIGIEKTAELDFSGADFAGADRFANSERTRSR
jgi:hypothetical protein